MRKGGRAALGTQAGWLERCVNKVLDGVRCVCVARVAQIKGGGILFDACGKSKPGGVCGRASDGGLFSSLLLRSSSRSSGLPKLEI